MILFYIAVYAIIVFFFVVERVLRKGDDAKTMEKSKYDKRSTDFLGFSFVTTILVLLITPILNHFNIGMIKINIIFNIFGLLIMTSGVVIRIIAAVTLGRFYTRTLRQTDHHEIISNGIYKRIRHPGYLGTILLYIGAGISVGNLFSILFITVLVLIAYNYRMTIEEKMLIDIFGDKYSIYRKKTKRIIPFIY